MKKLFFILFLFSKTSYGQQMPNCIDKSYPGCKDSFCLNSLDKLCWLQCYIDNVFPTSSTNVAKQYEKFDMTSTVLSVPRDSVPWGAYYFPYKRGGITQRWQSTSNTHPIDSAVLKPEVLRKMGTAELNQLSPALKMDLFLHDSKFSFTKIELDRRTDARRKSMGVVELNGGFCNGARAAGVLSLEPTKQVAINNSIPGVKPFVFYPSDIKAILAASFFHPQHFIALGSNSIANGLCGVDPITFDITIRCLVGRFKKPFFIDADTTKNLDNKTVLKFDRAIKSIVKSGNNKIVTISMIVMTLAEFDPMSANRNTKSEIFKAIAQADLRRVSAKDINDKHRPKFQFYKYEYQIVVDNNDMIDFNSGKWLISKETTRPDFAWMAWGEGNDDCSYYDDLEHSGNPNLHFSDVKKLATKSY